MGSWSHGYHRTLLSNFEEFFKTFWSQRESLKLTFRVFYSDVMFRSNEG